MRLSPSFPSFTVIEHSESSLVANAFVNISGMCCTMAIAGESGGIFINTSFNASVPPVEAPMNIILLVPLNTV